MGPARAYLRCAGGALGVGLASQRGPTRPVRAAIAPSSISVTVLTRADVFVALPDTVEGDSILQNLKCEMPGIDVRPWDFAMDGDAVQVRRGSSHAALIAFMANRLPGETPMTQVRKELGLSPDGLASLRRALRDPTHALSKTLAAIGVRYVSNGAGRGSRSQLIKASLLDLSPRLFGGERQAPSAESFGFTAEKATA